MLANQSLTGASGVLMVVLVQSLGMPPLLWGILFFLPRLVDAISDPVMAYITDNTTSKWGRRKPYIVVGAILTGVFFALSWQIYPENGVMYNFLYVLGFSLCSFILGTIYSIPFVALGYEMSDDYHERTRLMAWSQWVGQWAWVITPWLWVVIYSPDFFDGPAAAAREIAIWVGSVSVILMLVPAVICQSRPVSNIKENAKKTFKEVVSSFYSGILFAIKLRPFQKICAATFLVYNSFIAVASFSWFIIVYYIFNGSAETAGTWPAWFNSISAIPTCFLVIPLVNYMSRHLGKRDAFIISQMISIVGYLIFIWGFNPDNPYLMFIALPLTAFGIGGIFTIMLSMTADVCDLDQLENGTRREGNFAAVYWWTVKFGSAFAALMTGGLLSFFGFDQSVQVQTEQALFGIKYAYIFIPILGSLGAIFVMKNYDLTESKSNEIREKLKQLGQQELVASGN